MPVPFWLWATGGAAAVAFSFVAIGLTVRADVAPPRERRLDLWRFGVVRLATARPVREAARIAAVALLGLVVAAGLVGDQTPTRNLAPTFVWVIWWVGFAYVSALIGNLWAVVNPWAAVFDWGERAARGLGATGLAFRLPYPLRLGVWPGVLLFAAFAWVELIYTGRAVPRRLAVVVLGYSAIVWTGMVLFGRAAWLRYGDPFAITFGILARFAPIEARVTDRAMCLGCPADCAAQKTCTDCGDCLARAPLAARALNFRPYGSGLLADAATPSTAAFVVVLLATVAFDGFMATPAWASIESTLYGVLGPLGPSRLTIVPTIGLAIFPVLFAFVFACFAAWMARMGGAELTTRAVARTFVLSLVPIAVAYHLAHYLTYLLIQGQLVIRLASDPFGYGWDVFGTAHHRPDIAIVGARFAWYTAVLAIVVGHIVAVYVAHVMALRAYRTRRAAIRSQVPMLLLMIGYTMVSLWIIAQPIVESSPG